MKAVIVFCILYHSFSISSAERDGVKTRMGGDEELSYSNYFTDLSMMGAEIGKPGQEDVEFEFSYLMMSMSHAYFAKTSKGREGSKKESNGGSGSGDGEVKKGDKKGDKADGDKKGKGDKIEGSKGGKGLSYSLSMDSSYFSMDAKAEKNGGKREGVKKGDKKVDTKAGKEGSKGGKGLSYSLSMDSSYFSMDAKAEKEDGKQKGDKVSKTEKEDVKKTGKRENDGDDDMDGKSGKKDGGDDDMDGKSGKKDGKGGKEGSYSYSLSMDSKAGKGGKVAKFDKCVKENPAIRLAEYISSFGWCSASDFDCYVEIAESFMDGYENGTEAWIKGASPQDVAEMGKAVGTPEPTRMEACVLAFALINAMRGTCNYNKNYPAYVNVAANGIYGYADYKYNILTCKYDGKTFKQIYDKPLTKETIAFIESGFN